MEPGVIERLFYFNLELWRPRGFSTLIWMEGNQGISLPWNLGRLRGFSISIFELWQPRGFSTSIWMEGNQGTSLPRNLGRLRGFSISIFELWRPRGFFTSIWMEGNQGASLPLNLGRLRGFFISILNCVDQGASLPQFEWKVTKELLYLGT